MRASQWLREVVYDTRTLTISQKIPVTYQFCYQPSRPLQNWIALLSQSQYPIIHLRASIEDGPTIKLKTKLSWKKPGYLLDIYCRRLIVQDQQDLDLISFILPSNYPAYKLHFVSNKQRNHHRRNLQMPALIMKSRASG